MTSPIEILNKAEKTIRISDHMIYITYPLIRENKLLKSILKQIYGTAEEVIDAVLQHEWTFKRIAQPGRGITLANSQNFELFQKCTARYSITLQETEKLKELLKLMVKHKESSIEFTRKDKLVFMSNNARTESIGLEDLKNYLTVLKSILRKAKAKIDVPIWQA